jgi:hypothetical protein
VDQISLIDKREITAERRKNRAQFLGKLKNALASRPAQKELIKEARCGGTGVIPVFRRLRKEDYKCEASLGYTDPVSKQRIDKRSADR